MNKEEIRATKQKRRNEKHTHLHKGIKPNYLNKHLSITNNLLG